MKLPSGVLSKSGLLGLLACCSLLLSSCTNTPHNPRNASVALAHPTTSVGMGSTAATFSPKQGRVLGLQPADLNSPLFTPVSAEGELERELDKIVQKAGRKYRSRVGVAITTAEGTFSAGDLGTSPAWSTIKVPIAIAALRHGAPKSLVDPTIKESDNDTAWQLWSLIQNQHTSPMKAVNEVLKEGHSTARWNRAILSEGGANGNVAFGYVEWPLAQQSKFGAYLRCVSKSYYVVRDTDKIVDWQRYGLTAHPDIRAKSGWGLDDTTGHYTHRQVGMFLIPGGTFGIAITTVRYQGAKEGEEVSFQKSKDTLQEVSAAVIKLIAAYEHQGLIAPTADC